MAIIISRLIARGNKIKKSALRIKENPAQLFGLPDWPNDRIYPQTTSQGRLFKKAILGFHYGIMQ